MSGGIKVSNRDNPIVFFDVSVGGKEIGRLKIEVYFKLKVMIFIFVENFDFCSKIWDNNINFAFVQKFVFYPQFRFCPKFRYLFKNLGQ